MNQLINQITTEMISTEELFEELGIQYLPREQRAVLIVVYDLSIRFDVAKQMHIMLHPILLNMSDFDIHEALLALVNEGYISGHELNQFSPIWPNEKAESAEFASSF